MDKQLILKIFEGFSIQRWNDLIRPFDLVEMDKASEKMVIAYIIGKYEEKKGIKINWKWMAYASLFDLLKKIALCDIKAPVQQMLKKEFTREYMRLNEWVLKQYRQLIKDDSLFSEFTIYIGQKAGSFALPENLKDSVRVYNAAHKYSTIRELEMLSVVNEKERLSKIDTELKADIQPYLDLEGLVYVFVHFIDQVEHGEVERQTFVAEVGKTVEEVGVLTTEVDGYHIALILHTLRDEGLGPGNVANHTIPLSRTESCREHQHVVITLETSLHHRREVAALTTRLVDGNTDGSQSWQVHQQIVDQITETPIIMAPDNGSQSHTILSTKGMVADKGIELTILRIRQILLAFNLKCHVEILDTCLQPFDARLIAIVPKESVHFVLMGNTFQPAYERPGYILCLTAHLAF